MNNDAKDVIGKLRAVNICIILLNMGDYSFPLDGRMREILAEHHPRFLRMIDLVSELARFDGLKHELLSCTDDILDNNSDNFYTRDYVDMLISVYRGGAELYHLRYDDATSVRVFLSETCRSSASELCQAVIWLRIAFGASYPNLPLSPLREGWSSFCELVREIGGSSLETTPQQLLDLTLRSWRFSETVVAALDRVDTSDTADMPHKTAFLQSVAEVDTALELGSA